MVRVFAALVLAVFMSATATAHAKVPRDFVGMISDGPMLTADVNLEDELDEMEASGVGSLRFSIYWNELQPHKSQADIPAGDEARFTDVEGVPTDFTSLDHFVGEAAKRGFDLLPVVLRTPEWARRHKDVLASTPTAKGRVAYANFMKALVERYGPGGAFWQDNPYVAERPIERWQVWNEPNGPVFWAEQPGLPDYVKLLKVAAPAIREADPDAQIVLAGLFGKAWQPLRRLYIYGAGDYFDVAAVNPFSFEVSNVMKIIRKSRDVMHRRNADDTPLLVTELSWPSALHKTKFPYGFEVTEKGQAQRVRASVTRIANESKKLGVEGFFWSTWVSYDRSKQQSFDYAGLRRVKGEKVVAKPAFHAFKRVVARITG